GIYGVISYAVSQRTHEIGIRMALGAQVSDVLRMLIWRGMSLTLVGVAIGLTVALALTRAIKSLLFNVSATDPGTFALIALLLVAIAMIASYIPVPIRSSNGIEKASVSIGAGSRKRRSAVRRSTKRFGS